MILNFETVLKSNDVSVWHVKDYLNVPTEDIEATATATVYWQAEIDERKDGIEGIVTKVNDVEVHVDWEVDAEYASDAGEKEALIAAGGVEMRHSIEGSFDLSTVTHKFNIIDDELEFKDGQLFPDEVDIDLKGSSPDSTGDITIK